MDDDGNTTFTKLTENGEVPEVVSVSFKSQGPYVKMITRETEFDEELSRKAEWNWGRNYERATSTPLRSEATARLTRWHQIMFQRTVSFFIGELLRARVRRRVTA